MRSTRSFVVSALLALSLPASHLVAQSTGVLRGRVTDVDGNALPGCAVRVNGAAVTAESDSTGWYTLVAAPAGAQRLAASCLGFEDRVVDIEIEERATSRADVALEARRYQEEVTVLANPILEGQAKALNQQKTAINIKNVVSADLIGSFPDPNAAEATQRLPGVTLQRDQGEGRYIIVRGTEPRLTGAMINGERIPSPEGDTRYVALDVVPADMLESIEVTKAITPDMDGDSIGGTVDLLTKRVPASQHVNAAAGFGYNDISDDDILQGNLTWGSQFGADDRFGALLGASYLETDRGSENFEVAYDDGDLDALEIRDYTITREREGYTVDLDARPTDRDSLTLRGIFNEYGDQEFRRRKTEAPGDDAIERELKDRFEVQEIESYSLRGERVLSGAGAILDYTASFHQSMESEPHSVYSIFVQEDVEFDPNVSADSIDPDNIQANPLNEDFDEYLLDKLELVDARTEDEDMVAGTDLTLPIGGGDRGFWKLGGKYRAKEKFRNNRLDEVEAEDDLFFTDFIDPSFNGGSIIDGRYEVGPFQGRSQVNEILNGGFDLEFEQDLEEELADYDAEEDTLAGYAMAQLDLKSNLRLLGGARYETTDASYSANELIFDEDGDPESLIPVTGDNDQSELLPMAHLVWDLDGRANLRAAATRTLSRPNFSDLAPFQLILRDDLEIERGNPELDWSTAVNLDLLYEKYFTTVGVFSAGVFYKDIADNIFLTRSEEDRDGETFDVTQPINGDGAELYGLELAYQNRFASLPEPFDGLGFYFNVTLTDSSAELAGRPGFDLVGQSDTSGNLALSYEKAGFSGRLSLNHHDDYLFEVGGEPAEDLFVDDHQQLDFSASQRLTSKLRLFLELINLTDEPLRVYEGSVDRPIQEEYYSWWGTIGVKVNL